MNAKLTRNGAFQHYVVPETTVLFGVAVTLTSNHADAEDLVQETLVRAYRSIDGFDGRYPRAWLCTIMRNANANRHRRQRPSLLAEGDASDMADRHVVDSERADAFIELQFEEAISHALAALSEPLRCAIELVDIQGLTYAEAGCVLGVPDGTVMSRVHRARTKMRERLDRAGLAPRSTS